MQISEMFGEWQLNLFLLEAAKSSYCRGEKGFPLILTDYPLLHLILCGCAFPSIFGPAYVLLWHL